MCYTQKKLRGPTADDPFAGRLEVLEEALAIELVHLHDEPRELVAYFCLLLASAQALFDLRNALRETSKRRRWYHGLGRVLLRGTGYASKPWDCLAATGSFA